MIQADFFKMNQSPLLELFFKPSVPWAIDLPNLSAHRWVHRVLVIDTPTVDHIDHCAQVAALLPDLTAWKVLDLVVITRTGSTAFRVRLVGKDGGVKLDRAVVLSADELRALIDAMPMVRHKAARTPRS